MMHKVYFDRRYIEIEDDASYDAFRSMFKEVTAAGGLVSDGDGKVMLIRRNGIWDLPKGHLEGKETTEQCSIREVEEETAAVGLTPVKLLCVTDHCYFREGIWYLKHTWWYDMNCGECTGKPQTEEGISEVRWITENEVEAYIRDSYASIIDVFKTKFML